MALIAEVSHHELLFEGYSFLTQQQYPDTQQQHPERSNNTLIASTTTGLAATP